MSSKCEICGKIPTYGHKVSHSKRHTNRRWKVNSHSATITLGGQTKKLLLCTRCIRTYQKRIAA